MTGDTFKINGNEISRIYSQSRILTNLVIIVRIIIPAGHAACTANRDRNPERIQNGIKRNQTERVLVLYWISVVGTSVEIIIKLFHTSWIQDEPKYRTVTSENQLQSGTISWKFPIDFLFFYTFPRVMDTRETQISNVFI